MISISPLSPLLSRAGTALAFLSLILVPVGLDSQDSTPKGETPPASLEPPPKEAHGKEKKPPLIRSLDEWRRMDGQLHQVGGQFLTVEKRRRQLLVQQNKLKEKFAEGDVTPGSVLLRPRMAEIASQYDEASGQARGLREQLGQALRSIYGSRRDLNEMLGARKEEIERTSPSNQSDQDREDLDRVHRWLNGLNRSEKDGPSQVFAGILGDEIGGPIAQTFAQRGSPRRHQGGGKFDPSATPPMKTPPPEGFSPPPNASPRLEIQPDGPHPPDEFQRLADRVRRLEQENRRAAELIHRQNEEIEELRQDVEKLHERKSLPTNP